jgi:SAM-dependent methyltransferase
VPYEQINSHLKGWDEVFAQRVWGRYPPEELVRFMGRRYAAVANKSVVRVLDIGCGPGANLWYLAREGYDIAGIDGSPTAIHQARERLNVDGLIGPERKTDLQAGNFAHLPWPDGSFDTVIDIESISMNRCDVIADALSEAHRVLKPGGVYFAKMFGMETTGYEAGTEVEPGTMRDPEEGPCAGFGHVHFFSETELPDRFSAFTELSLDWVKRSDMNGLWTIQEWLVTATK